MSRIALVVHVTVKPEHREAYLDIMRAHAANCLKIEEGCLYFDVGADRADENRIVLYEVYRDQAALDSHAASAHLAKTQASYQGMLVDRKRIEFDVFD